MMRTTLLVALAGLLLCCVPACREASGKAPLRVGFITNGIDPFWTPAKVGAQKAAAEAGAEVIVKMPTKMGAAADQKQFMEDMLLRQVVGIAISPINAKDQTELLDQIAAKTILVTHDSDAPESKRRYFIGVDNYEAGRLCGKLVKQALPEGGKVMLFVGRLEQDNAARRRQGVIDELLDRSHDPERRDPNEGVIKNERYQILGCMTDGFDYSVAKAQAEDALTRHEDMGCMVGLFAYNAPQILQALGKERRGKVKVVSFDENKDTLAGIKAGHVHGTVVQDPHAYGYESIKLILALHAGGKGPAEPIIRVPARAITKDKVEAFEQELARLMSAGAGK